MRPDPDQLALQLMSLGFGAGSALFAIGAVMAIARTGPANAAYAVGALFFTSAAFVQWRMAAHHRRQSHSHATPDPKMSRRPRPRFDAEWWSASVQLIGTLYFNIMTLRALWINLQSGLYDTKVWRPDMFGSLMFLVASVIALQPAARLRRHRLIQGRSLLIGRTNLIGSAFFGVSAVASFAPLPGEVRDAWWTNAGTLLGALAFLVAAALTWPGSGAAAVRRADT